MPQDGPRFDHCNCESGISHFHLADTNERVGEVICVYVYGVVPAYRAG